MPLVNPPDAQLSGDPTWHACEWDPTPPPGLMPTPLLRPTSAEYIHWNAQLDGGPVQPFRLEVGGPDSTAPVKISATSKVLIRVLDSPETIIRDGGTIKYKGA